LASVGKVIAFGCTVGVEGDAGEVRGPLGAVEMASTGRPRISGRSTDHIEM
jgi:hypothetical protein